MCGFSGFITTDANVLIHAESVVSRMAQAIQHRGPDDAGAWADASAGIALGFRRLSILDLSSAGHQPMQSSSGRFVMSFNGEIYNHKDLRDLLSASQLGKPAQPWRSVKYERVYLMAYDSVSTARANLVQYFDWYNNERPHSSLDDVTPQQAYLDLLPELGQVA